MVDLVVEGRRMGLLEVPHLLGKGIMVGMEQIALVEVEVEQVLGVKTQLEVTRGMVELDCHHQ